MNEKKTKKDPPKQKDLPAMPDKDAVALEAEKYLYAKDKLDIAKYNLDLVRVDLISIMKRTNRSRVTVDGRTIVYKHSTSDKLNVSGENVNKSE